MQKTLTPAERLIVAADFKPTESDGFADVNRVDRYRQWVRMKVLKLAEELHDTGVYIKVNSALRACGYDLILEIQDCGLRVFADLKLFDIGGTLSTDGFLLKEAKPELLTTVCTAGVSAMRSLKEELPDTEVLGVTVLTSLSNDDSKALFTCTTEDAVMRFAEIAMAAELDGLICSAKEATTMKAKYGSRFTLNTPAIRPTWAIVPGDDQNPDRIMTPAKAIKAGADRIVVGRPIVNAKDPYDAVMCTLEEIASVTA